RSAREVQARGGRVVALGKFRESAAGEIKPRSVLILVEWTSREAFDSYCNDPKLADLHPHRANGTTDYIWHLCHKLEDLRLIFKSACRGSGAPPLAASRRARRASAARQPDGSLSPF